MTAAVRSVGTIFKTDDTPTASYVLEFPSDVEVGDLVLAFIAAEQGAGDMQIDPPPAGWIALSSNKDGTFTFDDIMADGTNHNSQLWSKFYVAEDGSSVTFTDAGGTHHAVGATIAIKEPGALDSYSTYGRGDGSYERVSTSSPTCISVTTNQASLILRFCSSARVGSRTLDSVPGGTTELFRETSGAVAAGDDVQIGASWSVQTVAEATGTAAFTLSGSEEWHAHTICIDLESLYPTPDATEPDPRSTVVYPYVRKGQKLG